MEWYKYAGFGLTWAMIIYLLNSAIAREWKQVKPKVAITYFVVTAAIGLYGEIFLDSMYNSIVGHPLWYYRIAPIWWIYLVIRYCDVGVVWISFILTT